MKKICFASTLLLLVFGLSTPAFAADTTDINYLLQLQPGVSESELKETIQGTAEQTGLSEEEIIQTSIQELENQLSLDQKETRPTFRGGSSGTYLLTKANNKGDLFYTPSATMGISHGHSGIYYAKDIIVESIPDTGVRKIAYNARNVEKYAVIQSVNTTQAKRDGAANWANTQIGSAYSYNFINNRNTAHTGAKNCSKLLWSAYTLSAGIDIDKDGGLGVYPRDIRDSPYVTTYKTIQ